MRSFHQKVNTNMFINILPGHHPMLNDFVVTIIALHVAAFTYVIYGITKSCFKTEEDSEVKPKWQ